MDDPGRTSVESSRGYRIEIERSASPGRSNTAGKLSLFCLFVVWLAFVHPVLTGKIFFPVDWARSTAPASLYAESTNFRNPLEVDAAEYYYPWREYLGRRLSRGELPLWDPHRFSGTPFAANSQTAVFYPLNWLFALGEPLVVTTILWMISTLVSLLLTYWFFRSLSLHPTACAFGAIAFTYSGFMIAWAAHPTFIASAMWLPLALGGLELAFRNRRIGLPLAGLGLALSVLGGHLQIAVFVWITAAIWAGTSAIVSAANHPGGRLRELSRGIGRIGAAFVLGAGFSAVQLISSAEFGSRIVRDRETYSSLIDDAIPWRHLLTFLQPNRFGNPLAGNYVGGINYTETAAYVGILTLIFAVLAIWRVRRRETAAFGSIALVGLATAFGTPLVRVFYEVVPGFSQLRMVGRFVGVAGFGICGLAVLAIDRLVRARTKILAPFLLVTTIVGVAAITASRIDIPGSRVSDTYLDPETLRALVVAGAGAMLVVAAWGWRTRPALFPVLLILVTGADLWLAGFNYHVYYERGPVYPSVPETEFLASRSGPRPRFVRSPDSTFGLNASLVYGLNDAQGRDVYILRDYVKLTSLIRDQSDNAFDYNFVGGFKADDFASPIFDLLGVNYVITDAQSAIKGDKSFSGKALILHRPTALPPAFLTSCWRPAGSPQTWSALKNFSNVAYVDPDDGLDSSMENCNQTGTASVTSYRPEHVTVQVESLAASILVLTDAWYPGWTATVDGQVRSVARVDFALRGVPVESGRHSVEFSYAPRWPLEGLAIFFVTLMVSVALWFGIGQSKKR